MSLLPVDEHNPNSVVRDVLLKPIIGTWYDNPYNLVGFVPCVGIVVVVFFLATRCGHRTQRVSGRSASWVGGVCVRVFVCVCVCV